jgi:hypothetical protein
MDHEPKWDGEDRRESRWAFKREVSVGNLLTMVALAMPLAIWAINVDRRVALVETVMVSQQHVDERQEQEAQRSRSEIRSELRELNGKVDRILERGAK